MDKPVKKNIEPLTKESFFKVLKKVSKKSPVISKKPSTKGNNAS